MAAMPTGIFAPSYSFFGGIPMYDIDRLINAGMDVETAFDIVFWPLPLAALNLDLDEDL